MSYEATRTWDQSTPNDGDLFQAEFVKIYSALNQIAPAGALTMYAGASVPAGYLICDGASYLRASYPDLFSAIGTVFGSADGTHFNVPDMRAAVPRGVGTSSGFTQDETISLGDKTDDAMQGHFHRYKYYNNQAGSGGGFHEGGSGATNNDDIGTVNIPVTDGSNGTPRTANETRVKSIGLNFIIKT